MAPAPEPRVAQNGTGPDSSLHDPVSQTIDTIAALHARAEQKVDRHQRAVETVTALLGRPAFLYLIQFLVVAWVLLNVFARRLGLPRIDAPPFYWLQGVIGLSALLLTVVVLITQNRQGRLAERRAQLDLQINLLTEQKVAKLIQLVEELRRDLPSVQNRHDPEAEAMTEATDPHAVLTALEVTLTHGDAIEELVGARDEADVERDKSDTGREL